MHNIKKINHTTLQTKLDGTIKTLKNELFLMALKPTKFLSAALNTTLHTLFVKCYIPFLS